MDRRKSISPAEMQTGEIAHAWVNDEVFASLAKVTDGWNLIFSQRDAGAISTHLATCADVAIVLMSLGVDIVGLTWHEGPPRSTDDAPAPPEPTEAQEAARAIEDLKQALGLHMAAEDDFADYEIINALENCMPDHDMDQVIDALGVSLRALRAWGGIAVRQPDSGVQWEPEQLQDWGQDGRGPDGPQRDWDDEDPSYNQPERPFGMPRGLGIGEPFKEDNGYD